MMLYPSINEIKKKADSRYTLCVLSAKRARDLIDGKPPLTDLDSERPVSIAAHEIDEDLITYRHIDPEEAKEAEEEAAAHAMEREEKAEEAAEAEGIDPEDAERAANADEPDDVEAEEDASRE